MIVILKQGTSKDQKNKLVDWFKDRGLKVHESEGEYKTILGLVGDVDGVDKDMIELLDIVEGVTRISEPYKSANRKFHPKDSVLELAPGVSLGGGNFAVIAGPLMAGSEKELLELAGKIKGSGADVLMGAFSERSTVSPRNDETGGAEFLAKVGKEAGMPVMAELLGLDQLDALEDVDIIEIGQRNMQNYEMLKGVGKIDKPVVLRRGIANTLEELLMSAEKIMEAGNPNVILCERGIRTFEQYTKSTFDVSAIPVLKQKTHLPVVADPSSALGDSGPVPAVAKAAAAAGADGLILEVAIDPRKAVMGGAETISADEFGKLMKSIKSVRDIG